MTQLIRLTQYLPKQNGALCRFHFMSTEMSHNTKSEVGIQYPRKYE